MGTKFVKTAKFSFKCKSCKKLSYAADVKASCCRSCKRQITKSCACGCSLKVTRSLWRFNNKPQYATGHHLKGKTYNEIYGTRLPKCGYQKGAANIAKRKEIRQKISKALSSRDEACMFSGKTKKEKLALRIQSAQRLMSGNYKHNYKGFRSRLEYTVAIGLKKYGLDFIYEQPYETPDGKLYIPDFKVGRRILEVSGFAYKQWRKDFAVKVKHLKKFKKYVHVIVPDAVYLLAKKLLVCKVWKMSQLDKMCKEWSR